MIENLYLIENSGEFTSCGLTRLTDEELNTIIKVFSHMNHPYFSPSICIYLLKEEDIKEIDINLLSDDPWDEDYIEEKNIFTLDNKYYTWTDKYFNPYVNDAKCVFDEDEERKGRKWNA